MEHTAKEMVPSDWLVNYNAKLSEDRELFEDYKTKLVVIGVALILVVPLHIYVFRRWQPSSTLLIA